ncbi:MAG: lysylphosphatidylglycerol synthase transmembrane domain-containing protein, partial [Candidatus Eiseniibacteriota bacterium]
MLMALLKIAISVALLWVLFAHIDAGAVLAQVTQARLVPLLAALAALLVLAVVQAYRWVVVLRAIGGRLGLKQAWLNVMIGLFFNQTLPSTIGGDAVRIWRAHKVGLDLRRAVNGVMIDRLAALLALLLFVLVCLPELHALIGDGAVFWAMPAVVVAGFVACAALLILDKLPSSFMRWRIVAGFARFSADARRTLLDRRYGPAVVAISLLLQISVSSSVWLIAIGLHL